MIKHTYPKSLNLQIEKWIPDFTALKKNELENPNEVLNILDAFLDQLINKDEFTNMIEIFDFFELSCIPHSRFLKKFKEGYIMKKSGGRHKAGVCAKISSIFCSKWSKRWFVVHEDGIFQIYTYILRILFKN
jgi:hypothetical protein